MEAEFRAFLESDLLSASSDDEHYFLESSDESNDDDVESRRKRHSTDSGSSSGTSSEPNNLALKISERERSGYFSTNASNPNLLPRAFNEVPNRLNVCLKNIVPNCFLQGHIFMGLSACGQFLLSYKVCSNDIAPTSHYLFNVSYKYSLYFWIFQPHKPLNTFYRTCLFDDHGVDSLKKVSMTQWKCADSRVLIVHGAAEEENEDSYITYIKVPRLGCLDCKKLRELNDDGVFRLNALCLKCNLTVHTKYSPTESDRTFNPYMNLICPERVIIVANGFIHMLHIDLEQASPMTLPLPHNNTPTNSPFLITHQENPSIQTVNESTGCDNKNNIVERIQADFSDTETDSTHSSCNNESQRQVAYGDSNSPARKTYDELLFTCSGSSGAGPSSASIAAASDQATSNVGNGASVTVVNHTGKRHHRIVTKSYRNGVTTIDIQNVPSTSTAAAADKSNAYEFSEDNEKCEKISTLRKRRLADKKYEFSEDNSENIIPYTKIRMANRSTVFNTSPSAGHSPRTLHRPYASPSSSPLPSHASPAGCDTHRCTPPPMHRGSPISLQQGFRSPPCSSPVGLAMMRSPGRPINTGQLYNHKSPPLSAASQQMLSFKPLGTLSPLQVSMAKRGHLDIGGAMSPNGNIPFLSPRRDDFRATEIPLHGVMEKPLCTKKFKRRYVEEDDAASVITSEEDDCISPGYHTSLPMEVHGSCYSEMQMISKASYAKLRCTSVVITQHSFDLEAFTYFAITSLCQKNQKTYDVFYDWASELISICPQSQTIICVLMAHFSATDQMPTSPTNCLNCSKKLDCVFHRCQYECRILFTWNMESGDYEVLDYGELMEQRKTANTLTNGNANTVSLAKRVKKLAQELATSVSKVQDYSNNLRVLYSSVKRSKKFITDYDNMIRLTLNKSCFY